jgi:hypothetical protein
MGQEKSISVLRSRVSALVEEESRLLTQAFELSRGGAERPRVDALFAQVQAKQVERNGLKKEIGNLLGTHRMHVAAEVWRPGVYDYRQEAGAPVVRVRITQGPLGLQVAMPGRREPVRIESLEGSFDGPLAADDPAAHREHAVDAGPGRARSRQAQPAEKPEARVRKPKKKPT